MVNLPETGRLTGDAALQQVKSNQRCAGLTPWRSTHCHPPEWEELMCEEKTPQPIRDQLSTRHIIAAAHLQYQH